MRDESYPLSTTHGRIAGRKKNVSRNFNRRHSLGYNFYAEGERGHYAYFQIFYFSFGD